MNFFEEIIVFDYAFDTSDRVTCVPLKKGHSHNTLIGVLTNLWFQIRLCNSIWTHRRNLKVTLWHSGGFSLMIPLVLTKILGIDVILFILGEPRTGYGMMEQGGFVKRRLIPKLLFILEFVSFAISDRIVVFNENILDYSVLKRFCGKISQFHFNFYEPDNSVPELCERDNSIVFIGRICDLKGVDNFARAVDLLLNREDVILDRVLFIGDGPAKTRLQSYFCSRHGYSEIVRFTGWLEHEEAMNLLSSAKVFVLPSKSEGLPKTLIEAMVRGVVPVVTPVGNIPGVITNGHDGILLKRDDPETIANEIMSLIQGDMVERLAKNSMETASRNFSFNRAMADFSQVLVDLNYNPEHGQVTAGGSG